MHLPYCATQSILMYWILMQSNLMLSGDIDDVKDLEIVFCGQDGNVFIVLIRNSGQTSEAIEWCHDPSTHKARVGAMAQVLSF